MHSMRNISLAVVALVLALPCAARAAGPQTIPSHETAAADCKADPSWFKPDAPEPSFVLADTNCAFHQWAVQEFLYLVQLVQKGPDKLARFLGMASPHALFLYQGDKPAPYPGSPATRFKLGAGMAHLRVGKSNDVSPVVFLPRTLKTENTTFNADTQAGSNAVLVDQRGQIVYYTSQVNKVYYDFVADDKNRYYLLDNVKKAPPATAFPVGTVEVKSSWRIAEKEGKTYIDHPEYYYTVKGQVCKDKDCKSTVEATMALVGLHVVGTVKDHPEMVWATFEHRANVPDCKETPVESVQLSFYSNKKNCGKDPFWEACNQIRKDDWTTPSEICRVHPYGEPGDKPENTANIKSIDLDVARFIETHPTPELKVWRYYTYVGAVWTTGNTDPAGLIKLDNASIRGSKKAANTSLESFTQEKNCLHCHTYQPPQIKLPDGSNCFSSLQDKSGWKNLYVSHLFGLLCQPKQ